MTLPHRLASALAFIAVVLSTLPSYAAGLQAATAPDAAGEPLQMRIWYPSGSTPVRQNFGTFHPVVAIDGALLGDHLPLVVVSHGTGGSALAHYDTAIALADAGFVVVTFDHPGDNYQDQSRAGFRRDLIERPRQVSAALDYVLNAWPLHERLDPTRIGIFGFSLGGFTALVSIGGAPDLRRMIELCRDFPRAPDCGFVRDHHGDQLDPAPFAAPHWTHDLRIKAAIVAAPAASFTFGPGGLGAVSVPVQLWIASNDQMAPARWNSDLVRQGLPSTIDVHIVKGAGHYAFLTPEICSQAPPSGCTDFHSAFNAAAVAFFQKALQ